MECATSQFINSRQSDVFYSTPLLLSLKLLAVGGMSRLWQPILSNPMRVPRINVRIRTKTFYSTINKSGLRYSIDNTPFQSAGPCSTGLFGYDSLRGPDELTKAAYDCIRQASQLVELVGKDEPNSSHLVVKRIDRLSDVLCTVLDACELLRNIHPDPKWIEAAESSFALLHNYLNKLNTNDALYSALKKARRGMSSGSQGDKVADLLLTDFEKSGIHMPVKSRNRFVALNDTIQQLGQQFSNSAFPHEQTVTFDNAYVELDGVPRRVVKSLVEETNSSNTAVVHVDSEIANLILRTARNPETRSRMFSAMNSASTGQIQTLEELLKARADLANLLEKESYAQYFLKDKMVQTPERLSRFLDNLAKSNRSPSQLEVAQLDDIRNQKYPGSRPVLTSDRLFYSQHLLSSSATKLEGLLAPYFSVGNTFEGISSILESIYGVFLQPERILPGEVWHPDVKKLSVVHLREGRIGTIYCDLYERKESEMRKYDNAAHFTVRCSRRVDDDEPLSTGYMKSINSERISYENGSKKRYQLPIVVLSTNFDKPYNGNPCLLSLPEIDTLFHEMGHAMHCNFTLM